MPGMELPDLDKILTAPPKKTTQKPKPNQDEAAFDKFKQLDSNNPRKANKQNLTGGGGDAFEKQATTIKDVMVQWCQCRTRSYKGIKIENFSTSWNDGMAFCALIHHFYPDAFDFDKLDPKNRRYNFDLAFRTADEKAGVMALLDVDDMVAMKKPDWKCVFTYVQALYKKLG